MNFKIQEQSWTRGSKEVDEIATQCTSLKALVHASYLKEIFIDKKKKKEISMSSTMAAFPVSINS